MVIETVTIKAQWTGAGPEDIDNGLVSVLEPSLIGIDSCPASELQFNSICTYVHILSEYGLFKYIG